jgi:hypothetical protein
MKTSTPRRPKDYDLRTKKTQRQIAPHQEDPVMKTSTPRRPRDKGSCIKKALESHLHTEKILEAKASGTKAYASRRS